jgi:hypothetical protein
MAAAIYQRPSDHVLKNATITINTGVDPGDATYGPTALVDDNPAKVAKINSTTAAWVADFGAAQRIDLVALIHHNFDAGANVKIQANTINGNWSGSPGPAFEAAITIPTWYGRTANPWPVNPWLDLTTCTPTKGTYNTTGWRYWRLVITSNSQNIQLGQWVMGPAIRRFDRNYKWHQVREVASPIIRSRTGFGVQTKYARGTHLVSFKLTEQPTTTFAGELRTTWIESGGAATPWLFIPDPTLNEAYFSTWGDDVQSLSYDIQNVWTHQIQIDEVARGLRPGT